MEKYEDKEICKNCGGICCKKCGCDYFVSDFESMKLDYLEEVLQSGYISIIASLCFNESKNGLLIPNPILSLRARNINRSEIDLLSLKLPCASLNEDGCIHDITKRPSGGSALIPKENMNCYSKIDRLEELKNWLPYQNILERLVKRHTGLTVPAKLKEDAYNLICDILTNNIENVSRLELIDIKNFLPMLIKAYPDVYEKVIKENKEKIYMKKD